MEAPVRESADNGSLNDAPKKPRRLEQDQHPDRPGLKVDSAPPPNMPESSEPPWKRKKPRGALAGDIATGELRPRLSLVPDRVPEPQSTPAVPGFGAIGPLLGVIAVVAAAIVGYRWGSAWQVTPSQEPAPASDRMDFTPGLAKSTANLQVSNPDSKPTAGPLPPTDAPKIAFLLKNGAELMASGDVAAARLMFQHAAEAGSAEAAFALAETYDPLVFRKSGRREAVSLDITLARSWYEKARNLGSAGAPERIVRLIQRPE